VDPCYALVFVLTLAPFFFWKFIAPMSAPDVYTFPSLEGLLFNLNARFTLIIFFLFMSASVPMLGSFSRLFLLMV